MPNLTRNDLEVLFTEEQLSNRIKELGREISANYADTSELHIICVLKGSFIFLADLVRAIDSDRVTIDFLALSSYGDSSTTSGVVRLVQDLSTPIEGKDVLIVEDIVDTGLTLNYLLENLETRKPKSIKVCTLLQKKAREIEKVPLDYVGFQVPDKFVLGYGVDYQEFYRTIPFIGYYNGDL